MNNSCLMLAMGFYTPIDLSFIIDRDHLSEDYGFEKNSHITMTYAKDLLIPRESIRDDIEILLGEEDSESFFNTLRLGRAYNLTDYFELGNFLGKESDYLVLKLKSDTQLYDFLGIIHKGLGVKYEIVDSFPSYNPHMTIAEMKLGTTEEYLKNNKLNLILEKSKVSFEDLILSYSSDDSIESRLPYSITTFHTVDRFFRENK